MFHLRSSLDFVSPSFLLSFDFDVFLSYVFYVRRSQVASYLWLHIFPCRLLTTDLVSVFFARESLLFVLFASNPHFDLHFISSAYLVRAHPFAPYRCFSFSNPQRTPTLTRCFVVIMRG